MKIKYYIKAELDLKGMKDVKYKHTLMIREKAEQFQMNQSQHDRDHIVTCCCCDQGYSAMTTTFGKTVYCPNEVAMAHAKINNSECKLDVKQVAFAVEMHVDISIWADHFRHTYEYAKSSCPGPNAGQADWEQNFGIELHKIKYEAVTQKEKDGAIKTVGPDDQFIMSQMQPAVSHGKFIKNRYFLAVRTDFDGCTCCHETPDGKTPLTIVPMVNPATYGFAPPADYVCVQLGMAQIVLHKE